LVPVDDFCVDSTEVTQDQYRAWLATNPSTAGQPVECAFNTDFAPLGSCSASSVVCQWDTGNCNDAPQVCVDWCDARAFCQAVGKRLCGSPSGGAAEYDDASAGQWRAACGGLYPYGDTYVQDTCHDQGGVAGAVRVGTHPECVVWHGARAVYDLSGNAAEWEDSCSAALGGADECRARGGSFLDTAASLTCEALPNPPLRRDSASSMVGFRCCT
jgi:formylglycine-generating enzyme required for sulfatase activity